MERGVWGSGCGVWGVGCGMCVCACTAVLGGPRPPPPDGLVTHAIAQQLGVLPLPLTAAIVGRYGAAHARSIRAAAHTVTSRHRGTSAQAPPYLPLPFPRRNSTPTPRAPPPTMQTNSCVSVSSDNLCDDHVPGEIVTMSMGSENDMDESIHDLVKVRHLHFHRHLHCHHRALTAHRRYTPLPCMSLPPARPP